MIKAMSAATIDDISGGRFRLGLGTSGDRVIEDFHGIRYDKPLTRLKETVQIILKAQRWISAVWSNH